MKLVMNMVRKPFKAGEVIFDFCEKSDDIYLIQGRPGGPIFSKARFWASVPKRSAPH